MWLSQFTELISGEIRYEVEEYPRLCKDCPSTEMLCVQHKNEHPHLYTSSYISSVIKEMHNIYSCADSGSEI